MADEINGSTSDGFHTFDELYHHRTILFMLLLAELHPMGPRGWKSWQHADGTMFDGFFIAGVDTPFGTATYHVKAEYYERFPAYRRERAPEFDGHTPEDTLERLEKMIMSTAYPLGEKHG